MKHIIKYICYITIFIIPPYISTAQISTKDFEDALLRANAKAAAKEIEKLAKEMFNEAKSVYEREIINSLNNVSRRDKTKNPYAYRIKIDNLSKICYFASDAEARRFVNEIESSRKAALNIFKEAKWNTKAYADAYNEVVRPIEQQLNRMMGSPVTMQKVKNSYYKGNAASKETEQNSNRYITNREQKLGIYANKLNKTGTLTIKQKEVSTKAINQLDNLNANFGEREKSAAYYDQSGILHLDPYAKIATQQDDWDQAWRESYANELKKDQEDAITLMKLYPLQNIFNIDLSSYSKEELNELAKEFKQHQLLSYMSHNVYHEEGEYGSAIKLLNAGYKIMSSETNPGPINDIIYKYCNNEDGFKADVYYNDKEKKWVIAYGGTDISVSKDGIADIVGTWLPGAIRYDEAQNKLSREFTNEIINQIINSEYPNYVNESRDKQEEIRKDVLSRLTFTGHSLGGRLATMNGILQGVETVVYNTAYIPFEMNEMIETNSQLKWNANNLVTSISTSDDPLTNIQDDPDYLTQKIKEGATDLIKSIKEGTIDLAKESLERAIKTSLPPIQLIENMELLGELVGIGVFYTKIKNDAITDAVKANELINKSESKKYQGDPSITAALESLATLTVNEQEQPKDLKDMSFSEILQLSQKEPYDEVNINISTNTSKLLRLQCYGKRKFIQTNTGHGINGIENAYSNGYNIITEYIKNHVSN